MAVTGHQAHDALDDLISGSDTGQVRYGWWCRYPSVTLSVSNRRILPVELASCLRCDADAYYMSA